MAAWARAPSRPARPTSSLCATPPAGRWQSRAGIRCTPTSRSRRAPAPTAIGPMWPSSTLPSSVGLFRMRRTG
eukprot:7098851-Prymnesium_polylepis.1